MGPPGGAWRRWILLGTGEALAVGLVLAPDARKHLTIYLLLCAAGSLLALIAARSLSGSGPPFLLLCGAVLRTTLLLRAPDLSDDLQRYVWDAQVAASGISPYAYAPADRAVAGIAPELAARVPHPDVRTVYPPVAQAVFRVAGSLRGGELWLRSFFAAADLSIVALILALGGPGAGFGAALYAFHPLAVTESAGQGHLDSLGVALLLASLVYLGRDRRLPAGAAFAFSVLTKYVSLVAALPLLRRGRLRLAGASLAVGLAIWAAATKGGVSPAGGLFDYASRWEFNSVLYPALASLLDSGGVPGHAKSLFIDLKERLGHPAWTQEFFPFFYAGFFARAVLGLALAATLIVIARRARDTEGAVFGSLAALLLVSPTLHPWYVLWVLPFAARRGEPAFLYFSFAVPLSYALLYRLTWLPPPLVYALEYVPFMVLIALTLLRRLPRPRPEEVRGEGTRAR